MKNLLTSCVNQAVLQEQGHAVLRNDITQLEVLPVTGIDVLNDIVYVTPAASGRVRGYSVAIESQYLLDRGDFEG
jgi:hypothetical protein